MSIQEGSIGLQIQYTVLKEDGTPQNISSANVPGSKKLVFTRPNGTVITKDAQFGTDGLDGLLTYTTISGDLVPSGIYQIQADLTMPNFQGRTATDTFQVYKNL